MKELNNKGKKKTKYPTNSAVQKKIKMKSKLKKKQH